MMRKTMILLLALLLCFGALAEEVWMPSPWTETTPEGLMETLGLEFGVPEGAEAVVWLMWEAEALAEMQFTWNGIGYTARIMPAAEFTDISGLYYEGWTEEECAIGWCEGKIKSVAMEYGEVHLCLWYDLVPGLMYSVSAVASAGETVDIAAMAEQVYLVTQGDADGDETSVYALLEACIGYEGTAGGSLKEAAAACALAEFAQNWSGDRAELEAAAQLPEELTVNIKSMEALMHEAFADYEAVEGLFDDAGVGERMQALIETEGAETKFTELCLAIAEIAG